ncbi:MAG: valine--tRNA ligase [Bacteroidales bacterium]|nr:valine--tRNA ligase [Bacteroidales bacterium]
MEIASKYNPSEVEDKWYKYWLDKGLFKSTPDTREAYTVVIPPPNVTGVLHMGHMLNNTIQDVLVRRARMMGKNACWVPGTDHASIATEAKVVAKLKEQGIDKRDIGREQFMVHAWEWKEKHGGIILEQLKKLGASCDWDRTSVTMDKPLYESVIQVFVDLYNKGLIYRGVRMVNWDPKALTAVSDEEVIYKESKSKLYYLRYYIENEDKYITIATTRPETILGDTAVCVHPEDERYKNIVGKRVIIPMIGRSIPVIADEYVDREFGTGCLKITPSHDINDYNIGLKHKLESINIFNDNGTLNENGLQYQGKDRFAVRKEIIADLENLGLIEKIEDYVNKVGHSERTDAVIEPKLSTQWFVKMKSLAQRALEVVENDTIKFHPIKFKNIYRHWLENVQDWCISRQLWWGQQIPAYYLPNGEVIVAKTKEEAYSIAQQKFGKNICSIDQMIQDEDVLDTWFSSRLWPISVFDGIRNPDNKEINYYYPTADLITAPDIIFFWVARMIMAGEEYRNEVPFHNVYFTGIVRDKLGRKMSKSLGNSPDPIELMNKYGADGVRCGMLLTAPAGNDLPFDEALCEQGRNFCNKIWNALRLIKGWTIDENLPQSDINKLAVQCFENVLNKTLLSIEENFEKYRLSEVLMATYKLIWDDFCAWYLEMIKPEYQQPIDKQTYLTSIAFFEKLMCLLHPFMPFITEEIWHTLANRSDNESIMIENMPKSSNFDNQLLQQFEKSKEVITGVRGLRNSKGISPKEKLQLFVKQNIAESNKAFDNIILKMCNLSQIQYIDTKMDNTLSFMVGNIEYYIPINIKIDIESEKKKLEEEIKYYEGFLQSVMKKLSNEKFVANAKPEVVETERKKQSDVTQKLQTLKDSLNKLMN